MSHADVWWRLLVAIGCLAYGAYGASVGDGWWAYAMAFLGTTSFASAVDRMPR